MTPVLTVPSIAYGFFRLFPFGSSQISSFHWPLDRAMTSRVVFADRPNKTPVGPAPLSGCYRRAVGRPDERNTAKRQRHTAFFFSAAPRRSQRMYHRYAAVDLSKDDTESNLHRERKFLEKCKERLEQYHRAAARQRLPHLKTIEENTCLLESRNKVQSEAVINKSQYKKLMRAVSCAKDGPVAEPTVMSAAEAGGGAIVNDTSA